MAKIAVLGGGRVGSAIANDLSVNHEVTLMDRDRITLDRLSSKNPKLEVCETDVANEIRLKGLLEPFDLVVGAVPGFLGYRTLKTVIAAKKNVVDISFFPEDPFQLQELAKENGVIAIVDAGVAPGLDNLILGFWDSRIRVQRFECLVGGLPVERKLPFQYKAPFSPIDVIEEYTRPARYMEGGQLITREPLTDIEWVDLPGVGTLEAFNSDGLRTLLDTCSHIPNMKEKTLRYPGHAELILNLKRAGFFDTHSISVNGQKVIPMEVSNQILFDQWLLEEGEEEFTVMRVDIDGEDDHEHHFIRYDILDRMDNKGVSSMARTTGYTATAMVRLVLEGKFVENGIHPLEDVGRSPGCYETTLLHLRERGIEVHGHAQEPENW